MAGRRGICRAHETMAKPLLTPNVGVGVSESVAGGRRRQQQHSECLHIILQLPSANPSGPSGRCARFAQSGRLFCFLLFTATDSGTIESCRVVQILHSAQVARRLDRSVAMAESTFPDSELDKHEFQSMPRVCTSSCRISLSYPDRLSGLASRDA